MKLEVLLLFENLHAVAEEFMSRPARARGLKLKSSINCMSRGESRPARARGLKRMQSLENVDICLSRPARARGLKRGQPGDSRDGEGRAPRGRVD